MGKRIVLASTALVLLAGFGAQQAHAAPADSCLSAPKGAAPKGQHWYYHLDRAAHRKCWYLRDLIASEQKPAVSASTANAANAKDTQDADTPPPKAAAAPPKAAAAPPKRAARSHAETHGAPATPDVPRQAVRQPPASQIQSPWPSAPPTIAPVKSTASANEAANALAPAGAAAPSKDEPPTADASGTVPIPNQTPNTAAPGSTAALPASVWTDPPPAPKGSVVPSSAESTRQNTGGTQTPVERKDVASHDAPPAQPAKPTATATEGHGAFMQNTLVFTSATILAGLAFFVFMLMRHQLLAFARKGQFTHRLRPIWLQVKSRLANRKWSFFRRKGMQAPLVPEQVTMGRPYFGRREREMPRHRYEHQTK